MRMTKRMQPRVRRRTKVNQGRQKTLKPEISYVMNIKKKNDLTKPHWLKKMLLQEQFQQTQKEKEQEKKLQAEINNKMNERRKRRTNISTVNDTNIEATGLQKQLKEKEKQIKQLQKEANKSTQEKENEINMAIKEASRQLEDEHCLIIENKKKTSDVLLQKEKKKLQEHRKKRKQECVKFHKLKKKIEGGDVDAETLWRMSARNNCLMKQDESKNKKTRASQCSNDKK